MGSRKARLKLAFAAAVALAAVAAPTASADFYPVTKHGDHAPDGCTKSDCTLREAIRAANANPGKDRILLPSKRPYHLSRGGMPDDVAFRGDLDVKNDPLRIYHGSSGWATIDARGVDRVFEIFAGAKTTLENLRITGGDHPTSQSGSGGGIHTSADLILDNCILTGNRARGSSGEGGALQALDGKLWILDSEVTDNVSEDSSGALDIGNDGFTIKHSRFSGNRALFAGVGYFYGDGENVIGASTFSGNRSGGDAGTIYYSANGSLFVSRSTFSGNVAAGEGAGFTARNGDVKMVNVTIANNRAKSTGGGLWIQTRVTLNAVTIARNVSDSDQAGDEEGAGIYFASGAALPVKVRNTIVALNHLGSGLRNDCAGDPFTSFGHNLLSTRGPAGACDGFDESSDRVSGHPRLGDLKQNGGATKTVSLRRGSPAIGHANPASAPARDQRGVLRHDPDIGAFERR